MPINKKRGVLIIDFGSQVTQLIARRLRELNVWCEIFPFNKVTNEFLDEYCPKAIILSGGPASATNVDSPRATENVFEIGVPVLGICYGQQTMMMQLGGKVESGQSREFGRAYIERIEHNVLLEDMFDEGREQVWMSHGDHVVDLALGFKALAKSAGAPYAIIANDEKNFYGTQFHPEVYHTPNGRQLLKNFVFNIANCDNDWTMSNYRQEAIEKIKKQVGSGRVICGLSGGVDSTVAAVLIHEAIREQLTCVFVDHGFLRSNEREEVVGLFREKFNIPLIDIDASVRFFAAIDGITDPEKKRKTIGGLFIEIFEEEGRKIGAVDFLAQGTLYPDVIESVSATGGPSATIKSHHNVGGLPERMNLKLVEPLRELFKDEVRKLGRELGLTEYVVGRHPFPGPGLAIRIPGAVTREKVTILQNADAIFIDEIRKAGLYDEIWQAFCVLLPVNSVGVMGDERRFESVLALRAVSSTDGMTADFFGFENDFLGKVSTRIVNEVSGISRVVYDVTSKPPGTIEWE